MNTVQTGGGGGGGGGGNLRNGKGGGLDLWEVRVALYFDYIIIPIKCKLFTDRF